MFRSYRDVLTVPGAAGFTSAGTLARLPISMLGIGIVLLVRSSGDSYGIAGAVAGTFGLTQAVCSPLVARAVDRSGQSRVMRPAVAVHLAGLTLLLVSAHLHAPTVVLLLAAVLAGAPIGSFGSLTRARWSFVLRERPPALLQTAFAVESVLDEVVFITGPLLVTVLATRFSPVLALVAAALAVGTGGTLLLLQRRTEPLPSGVRQRSGTGVLRAPGVIVLVVTMMCDGVIFGSVEVDTVAFAAARHDLGVAGAVLACFALGSLLAGVVYGTVRWRATAGRRYLVAVLLLAAGVLPLLLIRSLPELAVVVFVAGFTISPMIISGMGVVQELVAPARLTEGLAFVSSSIGMGASFGGAIAGTAVDRLGARQAFVVPVVAAALAAVVLLLGARLLRPTADLRPASPAPRSPVPDQSPG